MKQEHTQNQKPQIYPKNLIPLYWRRKLKIALYNLRHRRSEQIWVHPSGLGFRLQIADESITIASINRWSKYRIGIAAEMYELAKRYGIDSLASLLRDRVVIDVGANIGELSLYCRQLGAKVIAIEPDPINHSALCENIDGTGIQSFQTALWHQNEILTFYSSVLRADSSLIPPDQYSDAFEIKAVTLDQFALSRGLERVFLLKADTEGAEPEMLRGAKNVLTRTCFVSIDCGPERQGAKTFDTCEQLLQELGFCTSALDAKRNILLGTNPNELKTQHIDFKAIPFPAQWPPP
ncbi:FkbM family methyltransferase [Thiorhodovibrio frisius]|uniref:Methyltransferase, FkbM family n=1 Tax=Thiorhodovibrio frisius TaxID=631362 RepID=H8YZ13_9GAMM|nr:FkbM family methyltransferase [Thiorhodovibrio frisius]EIC21940.1 methyltransferase, FkbM family [Thiorhodovibrio frisius]WPL24229.1 2-O-methyltransferase NoeI [Thiorhodovibrio frisius]